MKNILIIFERQVLVFPALVTVLACLSFLWGGHCAAWQWWISVAAVLTCGFVRQDRRTGFAAMGLFLGFLCVLWCVNHTMLTRTCVDVAVYHMPATRALIAGWNPIETSTPEGVASFLGVTVDDARFWMIISMAKTAWIFNAVAFFFTGDQMNLFFPVFYFFFAAISLRIWRVFADRSIWARLIMIMAVTVMLTAYNLTVDIVIGVAGIGLLVGFWDVLRGKRPDWISLFVFSFWMTTAKQLGALHCFLMWTVFAALYLRNWKRFRELSVFAVSLAALWLMATAAPYLTNWKNYGHPFYPCYTVDEAKLPVVDLVGDFKEQNADAENMGAVGRFVNAYVSSDLAMAYYSWKSGRQYAPSAKFYSYDNSEPNTRTPTRPWVKLAFCGLFLAIMVFGRKADRFAYLISFVATCAIPLEMIGYARYTPWMFWSVLPLLGVFDESAHRLVRWGGLTLVFCLLLPGTLKAVVSGAELVDFRHAANRALSEGLVKQISPVRHVTDNGKLGSVATLRQTSAVYGVSVGSETVLNGRVNFYTDEFQVETLPPYSYFHQLYKCKNRKVRLLMYGKLVLTSGLKFFKMLVCPSSQNSFRK